jgi:hypothetical protein
VTGQVLVEEGKLITRSMLKQIDTTTSFKVGDFLSQSTDI